MAEFCTSESDYFVRQLECPVCLVTMRPPIYLCPTGHSICKGCYNTAVECPQCSVSYGKVVGDAFEGEKLMTFKCPELCNPPAARGGNRYGVLGNGYFNNILCRTCGKGYNCIAYKGKLMARLKFNLLKEGFRPPRNYGLESMTACVVYPCEEDQCDAKYKLIDKKKHQSTCIYRTVDCLCDDCDWKGPVNSFHDHFKDGIGNDIGQYKLHCLAEKQSKFKLQIQEIFNRQQVVMLCDADNFPDYVFTFKLFKEPGKPFSFRLIQYGTFPAGFKIDGKVKFYSHKDPSYCRSMTLPVVNDFWTDDKLHFEEMPSTQWLTDNHFTDADENLIIEIDFWRKETPDEVCMASAVPSPKAEEEPDDVPKSDKPGKRQSTENEKEDPPIPSTSRQSARKRVKKEY